MTTTGTQVFHRPPYRPGPPLPKGEIALEPPPPLPEAQSGAMSAALTYLPMAAASGAMVLIFVQPGTQAIGYLAAALMGLSGVGMMVGQLGRTSGDRKRRMQAERRDYLRYLAQMRRRVRRAARAQQVALDWLHPVPESLWTAALTSRLWERRARADDFGEVRIGVGRQRLAVRVRAPQTKPVEDLEPLCASALRRFIQAYTVVPDLPTAVLLPAFARVQLRGDREAVLGMVRALLGQLAVFHSPEDVRLAACVAPERAAEWDWLKWLPHALHPAERDAAGPRRLVTGSYAELEALLGKDFADRPRFDAGAVPTDEEPFTVILLDAPVPAGARIGDAGFRNTVVLDVSGALPWKADRAALRLQVSADRIDAVDEDRAGREVRTEVGRPDALSLTRTRALAKLLAPRQLAGDDDTSDPLATDLELVTLLGVADAATFDPKTAWAARSPWDRLRVPIGVAPDGTPIELDIKESAQGGMGPHGMLIGATGSGKSELLRTLVLALAMTHSSETLNFVLIDFKGGATFIGMEELPHTSAVITNLADELPLVDRMQDAVQGELIRRQELLRRAGHSSLHDYERARLAGAALDPLPTLFVVVDEFSEMLSSRRELMDLFVMIGRLGRSLGVHLLLASQRLDEGRVHMLESHLSYRIGLRTFSATESRAVLGVPDAYELPPTPGSGFLKTGTGGLVRFRAAYVSGPYRSEVRRRQSVAAVRQQVVPYTTDYLPPTAPPDPDPAQPSEPGPDAGSDGPSAPSPGSDPAARSLLRVVLDRLHDAGPPARQVWLPPLAEPPTLDEVLPPLLADTERGLSAGDWVGRGALVVPVGVVDRPEVGVRDLLTVDLSGAGGHVGIAGAPHSGKSTLVRTLVSALALTHTPEEVQFYLLDFGGGTLAGLTGLPHVGDSAGRLDAERVTRTLAELSGLLHERERLFAAHGVESMEAFRRRRGEPWAAGLRTAEVFLVIDGWFTMRQDYDALEPVVSDLANRGLSYGIHLIVAATRWSEIRPWLRDLLGTRLELRLGDPVESEVNARTAAQVPAVPGRGLTMDGMHCLTALPRIDGVAGTDDLAEAGRDLVAAVAAAWPGPSAPAVRLLPQILPADRLPPPDGDLRVALGWDEQALAPVWHDFEQHPHLIVFGEAETGKTNLLRLVARAVQARYPLSEARIMLADYRRGLHESVPQERRLGYAVSGPALAKLVNEALPVLRNRLPDQDITPERLKLRDWWQGPRLFVLVDDYDLVGGPSAPLAGLLDLLPQGAEIGLHLVVTRTTSGAQRAMADPVLRRLWDIGTPALLFSCSREEGVFLGDVRPRKLPVGRAQLITRRHAPAIVQTALAAVPAPVPTG